MVLKPLLIHSCKSSVSIYIHGHLCSTLLPLALLKVVASIWTTLDHHVKSLVQFTSSLKNLPLLILRFLLLGLFLLFLCLKITVDKFIVVVMFPSLWALIFDLCIGQDQLKRFTNKLSRSLSLLALCWSK